MQKNLAGQERENLLRLRRAYNLLLAHFGHQHWWPGETPFEVCVGAILTQNTSWSNVERAMANLKAAGVLEPRKLFALNEAKLAELQSLCEAALDQKPRSQRLDYWQDFHAQLVMVGKHFCRPGRALCEGCPLQRLLPGNLGRRF